MSAVAVRFASLDVSAAAVEACHAIIAADERDQAGRFRHADHRRRFVVRRALRRLWLAEHIGTAPRDLSFDTNHHGKPQLPGGPQFSAAQSGDMMMLAIADRPIGCDIEAVDAALDWPPIAARFFAAKEVAALAALPEAAARQAFFECWARKEAFVKATGQGLSHPLDAFAVSVAPTARVLAGGAGWAMAAVTMPGHGCAVVAAGDECAVRVVTESADGCGDLWRVNSRPVE